MVIEFFGVALVALEGAATAASPPPSSGWCANDEVTGVCVRNWLSALSGWAAFLAAIIVGYASWRGVMKQVVIQEKSSVLEEKKFRETQTKELGHLTAAIERLSAFQQLFDNLDPSPKYPRLAAISANDTITSGLVDINPPDYAWSEHLRNTVEPLKNIVIAIKSSSTSDSDYSASEKELGPLVEELEKLLVTFKSRQSILADGLDARP